MNIARWFAAPAALLLPFAILACPKTPDATPGDAAAPTTSASAAPTAAATVAPTAVPTPPPPVVHPVVHDAGVVPSDAGATVDAAKPATAGPANLGACCAAIAQSAKSAPPAQQPLYAAFIGACNAGAVPPQFKNLPQCK